MMTKGPRKTDDRTDSRNADSRNGDHRNKPVREQPFDFYGGGAGRLK